MRINNKKDLPKWFSLKKYDCFSSMGDEALSFQMMTRVIAGSIGNDRIYSYFDNPIKDVSVISTSHIDGKDDDIDAKLFSVGPCQRIAEGFAVKPLTVHEVLSMCQLLDDLSINTYGNDYESMINKSRTHISILTKDNVPYNVSCVIDIRMSDELIFSSLKNMLPIWRKQLSVPEELFDEIKTSWSINRQKLISYRAFAFYDLMQWQRISGDRITTSVMAAALYPDGEYGEIAINQTIKGFVEKIFSEKSIEKIITEVIAKDGSV
ncbi:DUF6387 family protein [Phytobacter diazotrophicus]|uniref:DUF6387 family protein n=1 Tax=Phytobacter diazotrophicus TaxID=395631 RepID=UPI0013EE06A4|nr:hypothetical protein CRX67_27235 [Enterobacteriaceae bacterium A-F18]